MPPREFLTPRDKREELKTYRELTLKRDLKSVRNRKRVQASGVERVLGDGSATLPYLRVPKTRYLAVRREVQKRLLEEARAGGLGLPVDLLLEQLRARIEALTYEQLARESDDAASCHVPLANLNRALTSEERARFAASRAVGEKAEKSRRQKISHTALDQVLGHIEQRQAHNPARYQTLWAQVVGADAAQQTYLERVDAATATAYFRCTNSVLSMDLQRRTGLVAKLAKALGVPIRKLRAQF